MSNSPSLTITELRELLDYNPLTGTLTWKTRGPHLFRGSQQSPEHSAKIWNARHAGKPALATLNADGYPHGAIFGETYSAHTVCWALHHGAWPVHGIDHENGNRSDNRATNLRDVPGAVNSKNQRRNRRNTSGITGVHLHRRTGKWVASIKADGKMKNLGYFVTKEAAAEARQQANQRYGYHANHGRIAA